MDTRRENGRSITIFCQFFLSHSSEKLRTGTFLIFTKFLVSKNFMDKCLGMKEVEVSRYSVKKIFVVSEYRKTS